MSDSYHVTIKNLTKYTKKELDDMADDPNSELAEHAKKSAEKKKIKQERKERKIKQET